jgi:hypothetical protein
VLSLLSFGGRVVFSPVSFASVSWVSFPSSGSVSSSDEEPERSGDIRIRLAFDDRSVPTPYTQPSWLATYNVSFATARDRKPLPFNAPTTSPVSASRAKSNALPSTSRSP